MRRCKGVVVAMNQCGGCVEIVVAGAEPGAFPIDNSCFRMIANCEGSDWIGRPVEYVDAHMRFLDSHPEDEDVEMMQPASNGDAARGMGAASHDHQSCRRIRT
ncbi:MAG: hypothetical protein J5J06_15565 [Phycisphaerae bacterium]|nr:hypothetical protein [Phycisphaerae bacterium]